MIDLFLYYESFLEKLDSLGREYYRLGDLNCNLASLQYYSNTRRLCEISDLFGPQQLIIEPTRITKSSSTLIDLIFTNYANRVVCSGASHIGISDHSLIHVYRKLSPAFPSFNLRWQTHIDKSSKKIASGRGAIISIRDLVPTPTLHCIYNALIQSQFDYCNIVLDN